MSFSPPPPGPTTPRIVPFSRRYERIVQGETIPLRVRVTPGAPVTFTSFDLGAFENSLTSINVLADRRGIATAKFTGTTGTVNDVRILAASPVASGQVRFRVNISLPRPAGVSTASTGHQNKTFTVTGRSGQPSEPT